MRNCAWIFDMIPMEVSLAAQMGCKQLEVPFFTFIQQQGEKLLGKAAMARFGGYFPIRFNYDDTFHSSGNMSIQCHPGEDYVVKHHRELGRQDESYYVCVAGEGAKTYLGFRDEGSCEGFLAAAQTAQKTGEEMDYERFLHAVPSKPGTQVMIPAGTIHASGHNQVVLEIGSLTVGSYTYKLYDYQRSDPQSGLKRPIHLRMGSLALRGERTRAWVEGNLVNHGGLIGQGDGWQEKAVGEHELLYFSLRALHFDRQIPQDTRGCFHVLALTEGEKVRAEKLDDPSCSYTLDYLDLVVIPASLGAYRLINLGEGPVTVHKTTLKDETPRG
jgi:mannose-6-phosphate isomerase